MFQMSPRTTRLLVTVLAVLAATALGGYWLSRPDPAAWAGPGAADASGAVVQARGDGECGWSDLVLLDLAPAAGLAVSGTFVQDEGGVLAEPELAEHFARANGSIRRYGPDATLPEDAVQTEWTRTDGVELWLRPDLDEYAYLVDGTVQAWPRAEPPLTCG